MGEMTVERAVEILKEHKRLLSNEEFREDEQTAIQVVLDELEALNECGACRAGEWASK